MRFYEENIIVLGPHEEDYPVASMAVFVSVEKIECDVPCALTAGTATLKLRVNHLEVDSEFDVTYRVPAPKILLGSFSNDGKFGS